MKTPIVDFVKKYAESGISRFHMPGHKGENFLGFERYDITEIQNADVLSQASGIIKMSEENTSSLFSSAHSFYVTQGSTTAICAMLATVKKSQEKRATVLAARNVHKAFVNACALLDFDVEWLMPQCFSNILECKISPAEVEQALRNFDELPAAVYLTSPDYLGNIQNISDVSKVCRKYGIPLLVDNAHGAYLKFLDSSMHPLDLGADMCCDSAHKTLPVLTGGAYLHVSKDAPKLFVDKAREKIALFSSTSPSYLILQSLDLCNAYLAKSYNKELKECIEKINDVKNFISDRGFSVCECEPLKIVIDAKKSGYCGESLAKVLRMNKIEPEFCDGDHLVLMITPQNRNIDFERLKKAFFSITPQREQKGEALTLLRPQRKMTVRAAVFAESEEVDVSGADGRICAELTVSCPPAVPVAVSGELISADMIKVFEKYRINKIRVVK